MFNRRGDGCSKKSHTRHMIGSLPSYQQTDNCLSVLLSVHAIHGNTREGQADLDELLLTLLYSGSQHLTMLSSPAEKM